MREIVRNLHKDDARNWRNDLGLARITVYQVVDIPAAQEKPDLHDTVQTQE